MQRQRQMGDWTDIFDRNAEVRLPEMSLVAICFG